MPVIRRSSQKVYSVLYKPHSSLKEYRCVYCGMPANTKDHIPSLASVERRGSEYFREIGVPFLLVRSCKDCNRSLSDNPLYTLEERKAYIFS